MSALSPELWHEISPYLDQALSLPEKERTAWLESFRVEKPELAKLLQGLLKEHIAAKQKHFLEGTPLPVANHASLAGQTIGSYRLISPIGEGGMGTVWLAERSDGRFERRVAIKFLHFYLATHDGAQRFKREGRILGKLAHPHIAELIDAGVTPNGEPYLVLEHVEGEQIDEYSDRRSLDVETRIHLFLDVLGAVAHAHANLIVHRDIKPSNVLVSKDGKVKLLDFGIAKLLENDAAPGTATLLTLESGGALTPRFAAPEQITGGAVTTATDVYALGVLLYLLLTGQHSVSSGLHSPADLIKAIVETEPPRASYAIAACEGKTIAARRNTTIEKLRRQLRGDLDTIVAKALKKSPAERYTSGTALASDLQRYLKHEPISARPDTVTYRVGKFVRRHRTAVALSALALLAVIGGIAGTLVQARTARRERDFALRQIDHAEALNEFNEFLLSDAAPSGKPFTVNELLGRAERILARQHGAEENRVQLLTSIGMQYSIQEQDAKAREVLEQAYKLSRALSDASIRAEASCNLASELTLDGELDRAESLFQEGLREIPNQEQFAPARIECLRRGSEVAQERGDVREGIARLEAARNALSRSPFHSDWTKVLVLLDLGEAYRVAGQNYKAVSLFEGVGALVSSLARDETQTAGVLFNDWALALGKLGRPLEAEKLFHRAIDIHRAGQTEETVPPVILNNYAITLRTLGRFQEAADYSERAYALAQRTGDQFATYRSLYMRALIYIDQGDFRKASVMLNQLEPMLRRNFPPGNMWFGFLASTQALLALGQGDSRSALADADRAVDVLESAIKATGQGSDDLPAVLLRRATVELQSARPAQAGADANRALIQLQAAAPSGNFSSSIGDAYLTLGQALAAQGDPNQAHAAFLAAAEHLANTLGPENSKTRAARRLAGQ